MDPSSGIADVDRFSTIVPMSPLVACLPIHVPSRTAVNQKGQKSAERLVMSDEMSKEIAGLLSRVDCGHIQMRNGYVLRGLMRASLQVTSGPMYKSDVSAASGQPRSWMQTLKMRGSRKYWLSSLTLLMVLSLHAKCNLICPN
jgi:hypothetical protein